ncbi:putative palmitoyltransferase ZDHHC16 [Termitomyces sp. J132]|nr:putative palmitoyltransferase ZDHHC16 [Termitomyces sp. J132]
MTTGAICFFDVIMPSLSFQIVTLPVCLMIALNLFMHYFYVCTVRPGFVDEPPAEPGHNMLWAKMSRPRKGKALMGRVKWSSIVNVTPAETTQCSKCGQTKPERTHHCRICKRCILKYDHHCPVRINQCVGLYNERHFVLFLSYLVLSTFCYAVLGYKQLIDALGITFTEWEYRVPALAYIIIYLLAAVLCLAVGIMLSYHVWSISCGETTVEGQDHEVYTKKAKSRGETFVNSYNLGRIRNLQLFLNIGEAGYPLYTLFIPFRIMPYTDGRSWARREGYNRHHGIRRGEELTDEEDEDA